MIRILLFLSIVSSLNAASRPYVELDGEAHTVVSINASGEAVLADGSMLKLKRGKQSLLLDFDDSYLASSVEVKLTGGPQLAIIDDVSWNVQYQASGELSHLVESFGVLIRTDSKGVKVMIPFPLKFDPGKEAATFDISIDPFRAWRDLIKTEPGNFFYECRLFSEGREILLEGEDKGRLLVDWERLTSIEDSRPELILPVVGQFLDYRKKKAQAVVEFVLNEEGATERVNVVRKTAGWFAEPARKMVEMSRFYPIVKEGKSVPARLKVPIEFSGSGN